MVLWLVREEEGRILVMIFRNQGFGSVRLRIARLVGGCWRGVDVSVRGRARGVMGCGAVGRGVGLSPVIRNEGVSVLYPWEWVWISSCEKEVPTAFSWWASTHPE